MKVRILLLLSGLLFSAVSPAQDVFRRFSSDTAKYPEELLTFMGFAAVETLPFEFQDLIQKWGDGTIPDTSKTEIILISNRMLEKYARPRPHFMSFVKILYLFGEMPDSYENQRNWIESMLDFSRSPDFSLPDQFYQMGEFKPGLQA